ncbi:DUF362 domain-containing protein [Desulforhopalus sp. IMCC35007]|uniref:DUF362 domain-containing protein n=1 Tax=Desulforhopalus sp. IMCC35007 TaxID=2569543 RepID=UPI0010AE155B|nr:DUF362 domain-containing protein [Desulforhopalus sp. IMCC35007]TKB10665.1 DUF362 domain-containing protein [Desulforhopalus sp. IMCC35007]
MENVFLSPCVKYEREKIANIVDRMARESGSFHSLRGATILLKPNLISGRGSALSCSHPEFIAGVALWLKGQGARVKLGDSPAFGAAKSVCHTRGIITALQGLNVECIEFSTPVKRRLKSGRVITLAGEAVECDYFIGLPRIKAHNQMYVTLAVKNIFGVVKGVNKAMLHMTCDNSHQQFSDIILDLIEVLPPQFHFIDGIEVMSESGPLDGKPLLVNCIGGSASPVALDTALLQLLQVEAQKSPLYMAAQKKGLQAADASTIHYPFAKPFEFYGSGFMAPELLNPIRFNPFRFLWGMGKRIGIKLGS